MAGMESYGRRAALAAGAVAATVVVALVLGGCSGAAYMVGPEESDESLTPAISAAAAGRLVEKVAAAGEAASGTGHFTLMVSDDEVTSFLNVASLLSQQLEQGALDDLLQTESFSELEGADLEGFQELLRYREPVLSVAEVWRKVGIRMEEPTVSFRNDGHIVVRGRGRLLVADVPFRMTAAPRVSQGEVVLDFVEGRLGPLPMPEALLDYLGHGVGQALLMGREYGEITEIRVTEGLLTVSGRLER